MDEELTLPQKLAVIFAIGAFFLFAFAVLTFLIYLSVMMWQGILNP